MGRRADKILSDALGEAMTDDFAELMTRFRGGDKSAASELVERFGPQIRRAIRVRGTGSRLGRVLDSEDLMQSVFRTLLEQRRNPELAVKGPGQLVTWLLTVARNRRNERTRDAGREKRGGKHADAGADGLAAVPAGGPSPSAVFADRDILERVLALLSPKEREIAQARADGVSWSELAKQAGTTPEALRKQFHRAIERIVETFSSGTPHS